MRKLISPMPTISSRVDEAPEENPSLSTARVLNHVLDRKGNPKGEKMLILARKSQALPSASYPRPQNQYAVNHFKQVADLLEHTMCQCAGTLTRSIFMYSSPSKTVTYRPSCLTTVAGKLASFSSLSTVSTQTSAPLSSAIIPICSTESYRAKFVNNRGSRLPDGEKKIRRSGPCERRNEDISQVEHREKAFCNLTVLGGLIYPADEDSMTEKCI